MFSLPACAFALLASSSSISIFIFNTEHLVHWRLTLAPIHETKFTNGLDSGQV